MAENDFISRRKRQLINEGREELAESLGKPSPRETQSSQPERAPDAMDFMEAYTDILATLTALRKTGYVPNPRTFKGHYDQINRQSNAELFHAVFDTDGYPVHTNPAFYSALVAVIQERGSKTVMQAGN